MAGFRIPGPLGVDDSSPGCTRLPGVAEHAPGVVGANVGDGLPGAPGFDPEVINSSAFTPRTREKAEQGARNLAIRFLPAGTTLYRIGSTRRFGEAIPAHANFESPWWMQENDFHRILNAGFQDTSWAARIFPAIASAWGTECDLQVSVKTRFDLCAWIGAGKAIDFEGQAVNDSDPAGYWFPDEGLRQLYIPGLREPCHGHPGLWRYAFTNRSTEPWLPIGAQNNLVTGKSYIPRADGQTVLPTGRRT
jgi:hypothetical protein